MDLFNLLSECGIKVKADIDTSKVSSIKAGGYAGLGVYPETPEQLIRSIEICRSLGEKYKIIGGCSNTFFGDGKYCGAVIFTKAIDHLDIQGKYLIAECGCTLANLLKRAASADLEIANPLFGIPGTLGGAVRNNAGAFGCEIGEAFIDGRFLNTDTLEICTLDRDQMNFGYRHSRLFDEPLILISGRLKAKQSSSDKCFEQFARYTRLRRSKQPNLPSLGSFFKRSDGIVPAQLIDSLGMKNYRIGDAAISDKHAGFIVNLGEATAREIDRLAKAVEERVMGAFGVMLQREAELVE